MPKTIDELAQCQKALAELKAQSQKTMQSSGLYKAWNNGYYTALTDMQDALDRIDKERE